MYTRPITVKQKNLIDVLCREYGLYHPRCTTLEEAKVWIGRTLKRVNSPRYKTKPKSRKKPPLGPLIKMMEQASRDLAHQTGQVPRYVNQARLPEHLTHQIEQAIIGGEDIHPTEFQHLAADAMYELSYRRGFLE